MRPLATNILIWSNVKPRIQWGLSILPIGLMFAAFVPIFAIAAWSASALGLGSGAVKGHPNGLVWLVLFLSIMVVLMLSGYAFGWVVNAAIARLYFGWPAEKIRDVFLESRIPADWRGPEGPEGKPVRQRPSWAVTRQKGRRHFVLVRGVFGWGSAMFIGVGLMPVLRHRHEPTLSYFAGQVCVWAIGGACFGFATWCWSEWLFKRQSADSVTERS